MVKKPNKKSPLKPEAPVAQPEAPAAEPEAPVAQPEAPVAQPETMPLLVSDDETTALEISLPNEINSPSRMPPPPPPPPRQQRQPGRMKMNFLL